MGSQHPKRPSRKPSSSRSRTSSRPRRASLWHMGCLFHVSHRYPYRAGANRVDRLAGILQHGLVAPGCCMDGSVRSDLLIQADGLVPPYDSLVFLHRYGKQSWLYTVAEPGRFFVFIDPEFPVLTQADMGRAWPVLCQDEVYVRERVPLQHLIGVVVHEADVETIVRDLSSHFLRSGIPLYDLDGAPLLEVRERP